MSPKFRGDADDWLDDESGRSAKKHPSKGKSKSKEEKQYIDAALCNATVSEVFPDLCQVVLDSNGERRLCTYRRSQFVSSHEERSPVAVGDRVQVAVLNERDATVEGIAKRSTSFVRLAPGENDEKPIHVIASNVDQVAIVSSVSNPEFSCGVVDRLCIAALSRGISPIIIVSKTDLGSERTAQPWNCYRQAGFDVFEVCAKTGAGVDALKASISGKATAFCGHSGVGKTTLLRRLLGREVGKVGDVNEKTGKGRHTTTSAALHPIVGENGIVIDTPGIREFDLAPIEGEVLVDVVKRLFPDLADQITDASSLVSDIEALPLEIAEQPRIIALRKVIEECSG